MSTLLRSVIFPGQGSQRVGMANDFVQTYSRAKEIFERASTALGFDIESICFKPNSRIDLTEFTQPCILTAEIAMWECLRHEMELNADYFAGHSLGEYSALVASETLPFEVALRLVHIRGKVMQWASPEGFGGMVAVTHDEKELPFKKLHALAVEAEIDLANENSPRQLVFSGEKSALKAFEAQVLSQIKLDGLRVIPLQTSAPFHSRHMGEAQNLYRKALLFYYGSFQPNFAPRVLSNSTGTFHKAETNAIIESLVQQMSGRVRWRENMENLVRYSTDIVEVGPNRPLGSFFRAMGKEISSIVDLKSAKRYFSKSAPDAKGTSSSQHQNDESLQHA